VLARNDRRTSGTALRDLADRAATGELAVAGLCSLAVALTEVGEVNLALALLEDARRRSPGDVWINHGLGRISQAARPTSLEEAIRYFTAAQAVRLESGHELAQALQGRGRDRDAIAVFRGLARANPKNGRHQFCLGEALRRKGLTREAADAFRGAAEGYRAILEVVPEHAGAHYNLAMALHGAGQVDEAIAEYRTTLALKLDQARVHLDLGRALAARGRLDEAIAEYRAALRRNSTLAEAHYALGRALHDRGQLDAAIETYRIALRLRPNDAEAHNALGVALQQEGRCDEAIAEFRTAHRFEPRHAGAHRNFADSLRAKGRLDEAIAQYLIALRLNPVDASTRCQLARTFRDRGEMDEAIAEYRAAFRYRPCDAEAHLDLARMLWRRGCLEEAIAEFRSGLQLPPAVDMLCNRAMKALSPEDRPMRNLLAPTLLSLALGAAASEPPPGDKRVAQARRSVSDEIVVTFRGMIDGSDQIKITQEAATWQHNHWQMPPEPVSINDIPWDPREQRVLKNEGMSRFLRFPVDFQSARLERVQGRDTIAFERGKGYAVVHLVDTPFEASLYEFRLIFRPLRRIAPVEADVVPKGAALGVAPKRAALEVAAEIAGSDELHINAQGARWVHHEWNWPAEVRLNEIKWIPKESPTLKNGGTTRFLGGSVDFSKARLARKEGRDTAVMEHVEGGLIIYFADSLLSPSHYELTIIFDD
jgi:tetratricopeptide (TPR) repeat protein